MQLAAIGHFLTISIYFFLGVSISFLDLQQFLPSSVHDCGIHDNNQTERFAISQPQNLSIGPSELHKKIGAKLVRSGNTGNVVRASCRMYVCMHCFVCGRHLVFQNSSFAHICLCR